MKSRKGLETRRALIRSAYDLISDSGIQPLKVASVCKTVGLRRNSFYTHFDDINNLLDALAEALLDRLRDGVDADLPLDRNNRTILRDRLNYILKAGRAEPKRARVIHQLYCFHRPTFNRLHNRVTSDVMFGVEHGHLNLPVKAATSLSRIVLASVMDVLREIGSEESDEIDTDLVLDMLMTVTVAAGQTV
ncbi:MAG: TetR/AcrR family transcriptional regulator [Pseudomonadota bacterium]